jgi:AraC family transcriptional activator of pobA
MTQATRPSPDRRAHASVQRIRSPLMRVGYGLAPGAAHLALLQAGEVSLRGPGQGAEVGRGIEGPRLLWLAEGGGGELVAEAGTRGSLLSIPGLALMRALPATPLGEQMRRTLGQTLSLPHEDPARLEPLLAGLEGERHSGALGSDVAEEHYLALVLLHLWRASRADLIAHGRAPQGLAERFVTLVGQHAREHWQVGDYARSLGVSRDRLGTAVRRATGLSPQGYLHRELTREACELLANTGMPVSQVAFRLGFSDPAYFTRFFARQTGTNPGQYRRQAKARRARGDQSYAAWP